MGSDNVGILTGKNESLIENIGVTGSVYGQRYEGGLVGVMSEGQYPTAMQIVMSTERLKSEV